MTRSLFISALLAGTVVAASSALAADDLPPEFRSSTFEIYVGAFGAANMLQSSYSNPNNTNPAARSGHLDGNAMGYGMRGGVDYVMDGWVLGVVGDWTFGLGERIARDALNDSELNMPHLGTIRARAGYTAGSALFYLTGGYAQAKMELDIDAPDTTGITGSSNDWTAGWTLGAGVDVALTEQVSMGVEYLYVNLDDVSYSFDGSNVTFDQDLDPLHSIRLGVNYAFPI